MFFIQGGFTINYPKTKNEMDKKVEEVKKKAEQISNKGVIGRDPSKIQKTLESHGRIKILLDELEYTMQKDIPVEDVLMKISSIEREIELIQEETER